MGQTQVMTIFLGPGLQSGRSLKNTVNKKLAFESAFIKISPALFAKSCFTAAYEENGLKLVLEKWS